MAMRSQIYEWDLFRGQTEGTGAVTDSTFATECSAIKTFTFLQASQGPPYPQYILNNTYLTGILDPTDVCIDTYSPATIKALAVSGTGRDIQNEEIVDRGNGYKNNAVFFVNGELPPIANGNYQRYQVTSIYEGGFGYSTGSATTTTTSGNGTGLVINISTVSADGEITAYSIEDGGSGYQIGDTVTITGGTSLAVLEITDVNYLTGDKFVNLGEQFSIFTEKGNTLSSKPQTKATQFIVVEAFGCTPTSFFPGTNGGAGSWNPNDYRGSKIKNSLGGPRAYMQFSINTTGYFKDSDGVARDGIPGNFAPYPLTLQFNTCGGERKQLPVYILPQQSWDLLMICYNDNISPIGTNKPQLVPTQEGQLQCFFKYVLYDGADALIAIKLLEAGINITPENVDEFKRNLFSNTINQTEQ